MHGQVKTLERTFFNLVFTVSEVRTKKITVK